MLAMHTTRKKNKMGAAAKLFFVISHPTSNAYFPFRRRRIFLF